MGWLPLLSRLAARVPGLVNALTSSRLAPALKRLGGIAAAARPPPLRRPDLPDLVPPPHTRGRRAARPGPALGRLLQQPLQPRRPQSRRGRPGTRRLPGRRSPTAPSAADSPGSPPASSASPAASPGAPPPRWLPPSAPAYPSSDWSRAAPRRSRATCPNSSTATPTPARSPGPPAPSPNSSSTTPPAGSPRGSRPARSARPTATSTPPPASAPTARCWRRMGIDNTVLDSGCCGLAGNFGFERGHYDVSVAAGEQALLPAVRSATDETRILADGFSCRTQIAQQTAAQRHPPRRTDRPGTAPHRHLHLTRTPLPSPPLPPASSRFLPTDKEHTRD